ncbi:MAG TPA: tetratricopeptide repeat protein [Chloroflexi bacterium]|nr:tetratricopeptide repeat protein [Chloroflexota bacterium]
MKTKLSLFSEKLIEAGWLVAVVAVPLFFNIYTARTFEPDKITLMRSIALIMLLAWLIKALEEGVGSNSQQTFGQRFKIWLKQPMTLPVLAIALMYVISTIFSISPQVSFWGSYQRLQGSYTFLSYILVFALMAANMKSRAQVERFITTVIIASVPVALYGIIQHNGLDPLPWAGDVTKRVASNMGNAIFVSSYLIMIIPLTVSRLIRSMKAIITEDQASWGHTILAAVYIFVLAIQLLTVWYSVSRGPQIGLLGAFALIGFLLILNLRHKAKDKSRLSFKEIGLSVGFAVVVGIVVALGGALGYGIGLAIESLLQAARLQLEGAAIIGGLIGVAIGFAGAFTYMAAAKKGWRWMWATWMVIGLAGGVGLISFLLVLKDPAGPLQSLREIPTLRRLAGTLDTEGGTGKVRVLIWGSALNLISPHPPLGVEGDYSDSINSIRPLIGYGPESMFNAFAYVYPTELAHVEQRGSSADRSHNETMDALVMTGVLGLIAFYFLMSSLFYFILKWLGWIPDKRAGQGLIGLMGAAGLSGIFIPYFLEGNFILSAVGLPFGLYGAMFLYLIWRALITQPDELDSATVTNAPILLIGFLGAFVGHFLEVHFVFSIAATYTYFWAYLGVVVALAKMRQLQVETQQSANLALPAADAVIEETAPAPKRRRRSRNRAPKRAATATPVVSRTPPENRDTWLGSLGLSMAIILVILIFDFVPVQFDLSTGRYSLLWMSSITILVGFAIALADTAVKKETWQTPINWGRGILLYIVTSLGYAGFYAVFHSIQRGNLIHGGARNAVDAANGVVGLLIGFYITLFLLMIIIAIMLMQKQAKRLPFWQSGNWWLYPPLAAAVLLLIFFKNINVVKADIYLKEGERYRNARQWDNAIALHQQGVNVDVDEDFYYLMLALDYQLQAQDANLSPQQRQQAWLKGEETALKARDLNKYNPDNTGNMGRYYFTLGQVLDKSYYQKAIEDFEKVIQLAPQNVQYYNLLAQVHYLLGDYDEALNWLEQSVALDSEYHPTWLQLGDTYAAKANVDKALEAHQEAIRLSPGSFADANFDNRLNFYLSTQRSEDLIQGFEDYLTDHPQDKQQRTPLWAIGHIALRNGDLDKAEQYFQQAIAKGYNNAKPFTSLGDAYLNQEKYQQAEAAYQQALQLKKPNAAQIYSSLGYIYARSNRLPEAIDANNKVLESLPDDFDSHKNLAILYQQSGQIDQALAHAQAALEVSPEENKPDIEAFINQLKNLQ